MALTLREILRCGGTAVKTLDGGVISVLNKVTDEQIDIGWSDDYEGSGPEYTYYGDLEDWPPFYEIPDPGEEDPYDIRELRLDWESTDWTIDPSDWQRIESSLKEIQENCAVLREDLYEHKNCVRTSNVPE